MEELVLLNCDIFSPLSLIVIPLLSNGLISTGLGILMSPKSITPFLTLLRFGLIIVGLPILGSMVLLVGFDGSLKLVNPSLLSITGLISKRGRLPSL
jgi:hypothetical protein